MTEEIRLKLARYHTKYNSYWRINHIPDHFGQNQSDFGKYEIKQIDEQWYIILKPNTE